MNKSERILRCLEESGIAVKENGDLLDVDSIEFITAILAIEEEFDIEIPNEYLLIDVLSNLNQIDAVVELQINKSGGIINT